MPNINISDFVGQVLRLFFIMSPFCTLSLVLAYSEEMKPAAQKRFAFRVGVAIWLVCLIFYFFGNLIFDFLGITLDAFSIGAGLVLLLNGIDMVRSSGVTAGRGGEPVEGDITVVPMAIPYTVGPGTIGALMLMGSSTSGDLAGMIVKVVVITCSGILMLVLLCNARRLERLLKRKGLSILTKLTGMFLVSVAAQIISGGICHLFRNNL